MLASMKIRNGGGSRIPTIKENQGLAGRCGRICPIDLAGVSLALPAPSRECRGLSWVARMAMVGAALMVAGCERDADIASRNLSQAADMFEINRRVVFYNSITGEYILTIEGLCALGNNDTNKRLSVTCKTGPQEFKKHFLGLSDNVTFFAEQVQPAKASAYHYRVIFKPLAIIPDIEVRR